MDDGDASAFFPSAPQGQNSPPISSLSSFPTHFKIMDVGRMLTCIPCSVISGLALVLYTGLALRENILRVNGSDIRSWWIYHYYSAMIMALVGLTWEIKGQPDCARKQRGVQLFLQWATLQGVAMLLQNRYQRQRLYIRIALGKAASIINFLAKRMDVVWGETAGVDGQLWLLCPILFVLQVFEAYVGLLLLKTAVVGEITEWQVVFCGMLLVFMAAGNFVNTVQTLMAKTKFKAKMKRSKEQVGNAVKAKAIPQKQHFLDG